MEKNNYAFGKILGEMYRIQNKLNMPCPASDAHIYGLLNGFEEAIEYEFKENIITSSEVNDVCDVLDEIWKDKAKMDAFTGFYEIENKLKAKGIDRFRAIPILKYIYAQNRFEELIDKMDTNNSPMECRTFKLGEFDY